MKISASLIVNSVFAVIILSSTLFISISTSQYDPWLDVNDDGFGGIDDIVGVAEHFGQEGTPIKNVNVTNWPVHQSVTPVYEYELVNGAGIGTSRYNANGFRLLHILMYAMGLSASETVTFEVRGYLWDSSHINNRAFPVASRTLDSTSNYYDMLIYVPSEEFDFIIDTPPGTTCHVYLSFYLT